MRPHNVSSAEVFLFSLPPLDTVDRFPLPFFSLQSILLTLSPLSQSCVFLPDKRDFYARNTLMGS